MAIAFNLPSEREAPEENFSRLNRLLTELYEVLCHILVARQPPPDPPGRLDRPYSESDINRPIASQPRTRSANIPPPLLLEPFLESSDDDDDDVFISPRTDSHDLFSTRNMEIFGSRHGIPRTPAGVLLSPRRERNFFGGNEKHWRDKGGTETDEPDAATVAPKDSVSSDSSIFSSIMTDKVSGSICTAVIFMLGWKLLSTKR